MSLCAFICFYHTRWENLTNISQYFIRFAILLDKNFFRLCFECSESIKYPISVDEHDMQKRKKKQQLPNVKKLIESTSGAFYLIFCKQWDFRELFHVFEVLTDALTHSPIQYNPIMNKLHSTVIRKTPFKWKWISNYQIHKL